MPTYVYKCDSCVSIVEIFHSYREKMSDCPECGQKNVLKKQLNVPVTLVKKAEISKTKPGDLVKQEILDKKEELKRQKEELIKRNNKK